MRAFVLLSLLLLSACTIREETFSPRDDAGADGGLSYTAPDLNAPAPGDDDDRSCPGGFARGSSIDEYRDGTANLFCE
jgi:hypothetical protein